MRSAAVDGFSQANGGGSCRGGEALTLGSRRWQQHAVVSRRVGRADACARWRLEREPTERWTSRRHGGISERGPGSRAEADCHSSARPPSSRPQEQLQLVPSLPNASYGCQSGRRPRPRSAPPHILDGKSARRRRTITAWESLILTAHFKGGCEGERSRARVESAVLRSTCVCDWNHWTIKRAADVSSGWVG